MTNHNNDPIRDIKSESDKWLEKLAKPSSSAQRRYVDKAKLTPSIQYAEPQIFDNIRSGTAARLWQNVRFPVLQWILFFILMTFVGSAIRGDGWSMVFSALLVSGVSVSVLPLSINKSKNQPYPTYLLARNLPKSRTLNLPVYFFCAYLCPFILYFKCFKRHRWAISPRLYISSPCFDYSLSSRRLDFIQSATATTCCYLCDLFYLCLCILFLVLCRSGRFCSIPKPNRPQ